MLNTSKALIIFFIAFAGTCLAQTTTVSVPSTGQNCGADGRDANWRIESSTIPEEPNTGQAFCVSTAPGPWAKPAPGTSWIGPGPDQADLDPSCCQGTVTYAVNFNVTDPSTASFQMSINGDEQFTVLLNGKPIYTSTGYTYATPVSLNVNSGFVNGANKLEMQVTSTGGSNGVYVNIAQPTTPPPTQTTTFYPDIKPPARYSLDALPEPVDASSGQYYDVFTDLYLGGPLGLEFKRYYSSQLTGLSSGLGPNWMHNFDVGVKASSTAAEVLLFTGREVKFTGGSGSWTLSSPSDAPYQLYESGSGFRFVDPNTALVYSFDSTGALTSIADRNGNAITVTPGPNGPTRAAWGPHSLTFAYSGAQLTSVSDETGRTVRFGYTGNLLTSYTDANGQTYNYTYTPSGALLVKRQLPTGDTPTTQTYDANGRVVAQSDSNNNVMKLAYDGKGNTTVTNPLGNSAVISSDSNGDVTQWKDALGATVRNLYDSAFRRFSTTDRAGNTVTWTYDAASGRIATRIDPLGNRTTFSYAPQTQNGATFYQLAGIMHADGTKTTYSRNSMGEVTAITQRDGSRLSFGYDDQGRLTSRTQANGAVTTYAYNPDFTLASSHDALGNQSQYMYDANGRLSKIIDASGSTVSFTYDARGRLLSKTNENGSTITGTYDAAGRLIARTNPYGGKTMYSWNGDSKLVSYTDPLGNVSRYAYDSTQRLSAFTNALGQTKQFTRDADGRVTSISDAAGIRASYTYNPDGLLTSFQDALGRTWKYGLNAMGRRTSVTTPRGSVVSFSYDSMGRVTAIKDALGQTSTNQYDALGRITQIQLPGGVTSTITPNALGLPTAITDPNGNTWKRDYDKLGRMVSHTDPLGNQTTYSYTATRLSGAATPTGTLAITVDPAGRITQRQYSDGTTLHYIYDAAGRIVGGDGVSIQRDAAGRIIASNGIVIKRDQLGRAAGISYADGKTVTYTYNDRGKLTQIADWAGGVTTFAYDAAGQMTSMQRANGIGSTYSYDADGWLISSTAGNLASISLTRDAAGRVVSADRNLPLAPALQASSDAFSYDAASRLSTATYDASGRITAQGNRTYTWDGASRLTSVTDTSSNSSTFKYDSLGEIASITTGSNTLNFVFNYALKLPSLSIVRQNGADQRYYVYLPDGKLLYSIEADGNKRHFYHFDESGNTAFLTDDGGNVTDAYSMTPYGENLNHTGTSDNPFTFQGQYGVIQEAPGLFYMRSRHYDSATARFLTPDPAVTGDPRGVAPYSYARGNPMVFNDPLGTGWFDWLFGLFSPPETPAVQPDDSSGNPDNSTNPAPDAQNQPPDNSDANPPAPTDGTPTDTSQPTTPDASADPWSATYLPYDPGSFAPTPADGWGQNNGVGDPSSAGDPNDQVFPDGDSLQITKNGMQLISQDGASLTITAWYTTADGGMRLISQDGASFTIPPDVVVPLISQDGASLGSVLSSSIANIVSHDGGSFSPTDISNAIQQIITHDGATLITDNGAAFSPAVVSALMNPGAN